MKRGISPLLSWVLIIGFVIAIGMFVIPVLIDWANKWNFDPDLNYCDDVAISIRNVCLEDGNLKFNLTNKGDFSIRKVTLSRITNITSEQWCMYDESDSYFPLTPGNGMNIELGVDNQFLFDITQDEFTECQTSNNPLDRAMVQIVVIPWIRPDPNSELIHCDDRKIIFDDTNILNSICT